jgi:hypothetical protein
MFRKGMLLILLTAFFAVSGCSIFDKEIKITDAKIVTGVDEKLMPVKILDVFPKDTSSVSCWFQWRDAKISAMIVAKWHYVTDDVHILDYNFTIPKKEGMGSVMLSMPEGKVLPSGSYKVELFSGKRLIKSLAFKVQ